MQHLAVVHIIRLPDPLLHLHLRMFNQLIQRIMLWPTFQPHDFPDGHLRRKMSLLVLLLVLVLMLVLVVVVVWARGGYSGGGGPPPSPPPR